MIYHISWQSDDLQKIGKYAWKILKTMVVSQNAGMTYLFINLVTLKVSGRNELPRKTFSSFSQSPPLKELNVLLGNSFLPKTDSCNKIY